MTSHESDPTDTRQEPLVSPDPRLGGPTVDAAVANAEAGSQAEGDHVPSGQEPSGDSRVEQMPEVVEHQQDPEQGNESDPE